MGKLADLRGQVSNWLTAEEYEPAKGKWRCRCRCGRTTYAGATEFKRGVAKSCGCWRKVKGHSPLFRHGHAGRDASPTYRVWSKLRGRCVNPTDPAWKDYGGRGITICDRWRDSFESFLDDMGERPDGLTIERVDNNRGYEPGNCVWADRKAQARNRRSNRVVEWRGESLPVAAWAERTGLSSGVIISRLNRGWDVERVLGEAAAPKGGQCGTPLEITFDGVTRSLAEWAALIGIRPKALHHRISRGWPLARALTGPSRRSRRRAPKAA